VDEEGLGSRWFRHYAPMVVAFILVGAIAAGTYVTLVPAQHEGWTIVTETNDRIPVLQVARVSEAIFRSRAVYGPALRTLNVNTPPLAYMAAHTDIRPVPDSNTLIVVGRAYTLTAAEAISNAFAKSFVAAFAARSGAQFTIFSRAQPGTLPTRIGRTTSIVLGATIGLWFGVATAVIHFRSRRPVLSLASAGAALRPDQAIVIGDRRTRGRVIPRRVRSWTPQTEARELEAIEKAVGHAGPVHLVVSGGRRVRRSSTVKSLESTVETYSDGEFKAMRRRGVWLVACDRGTSLRDLLDLREILRPHGQQTPALQLNLIWVD